MIGLALVLCAAPAIAAERFFVPRVAAGGTWVDNINAAPSGAKESEWASELKPGFSLAVDGPRVTAALEYDAQAIWFADNSDLDDVYHQASGNANFVLARDALFLDAFLRNDQQNIDLSGPVSGNNFLNTGNRTNALVYGISPYHLGQWGSWAESEVRLQYQGVDYSDTDPTAIQVEDSDTQSVNARIGSPREQRGYTWQTSISYQRTEFETAREFEYGIAEAELGIPVGLRTRLTASGGLESDVQADPSAGGFDEGFWFVGVDWRPTQLQSFEAKVGNRYFGTAWEVHWTRRGTRGEIGLDYVETPTTSSGVLGGSGGFQPGYVPDGVGQLDTRVFLSKRFSARASYQLVKTELGASLYHDSREFFDATAVTTTEERYSGAVLSATWAASTRMSVGLTANWEQRDLVTGAGKDDSSEFAVLLTRQLTRQLSAELRASHFRRNADATGDYNVNLASVYIQAQF